VAKPNYSFAKRQRDLAKQAKKAEKLKKRTKVDEEPAAADPAPTTESPTHRAR
jgi:hypothetical protein